MLGDTVAAVSTPRGRGGIAVIRISGDGTRDVLRRCFVPAGSAPWDNVRKSCFGKIVDGKDEIDTGLAVFFRAPHSYTGEDSAEISCHGGVAVTAAVLRAVFAAGAAPAAAGEFTQRAFINGKLSLTEAEAVGKLIDADTDSRRRLAYGAAAGRLKDAAGGVCSRLRRVLAALYAVIDYPDEDIGDEGEREIEGVLEASAAELRRLLATYKTGCAVSDGVVCAIVGSPNSGKSSLYNLLCRSDRAIVTDVAGTTRDTLWETVDVGGITLRIADTAGIRKTDDIVEAAGIDRTIGVMESAELVIAVFDGSEALKPEDRELTERLRGCGAAVICVINKSDLGGAADTSEFEGCADKTVVMSALTGDGLDRLHDAINGIYNSDGLSLDSDAVLWDVRHRAAVEKALELIEESRRALSAGDPADAVCTLAESALAELSMLDGRGVSEEIVAEIFSHFCVGK